MYSEDPLIKELQRQLTQRDQQIKELNSNLTLSSDKVTTLTLEFKDQLKTFKTQPQNTSVFTRESTNKEAISDLIKQLQSLRQEKQQITSDWHNDKQYLTSQITLLQEQVHSKQRDITQSEVNYRIKCNDLSESRTLCIELTENYNKAVTKQAQLEAQIRDIYDLMDRNGPPNNIDNSIEDSRELHRTQALNQLINLSKKRDQELQTNSADVANSNEQLLAADNLKLRKQITNQEVEMISLRLKVNECDGLVSATRAHNEALVTRVQELAKRVEDLTAASKNVDRLQEEFYNHCRDYMDKKRFIIEKNKRIEDKLRVEREVKVDLMKQIDQFKLDTEELRLQITSLVTELDGQDKIKNDLFAQRQSYKQKVRLANQRLKQVCKAMDDIAVTVYHKVINGEIQREEKERIEYIDNEITELTMKIRLKQEELTQEACFAQKYIDFV